MTLSLDGRAALVTGAGAGIGRAIALRFAASGAFVYVNDIRAEAAQAVCDEIGASSLPLVADMGDPDAVQAMLAGLHRLDIIVSNAGYDLEKSLFDTEVAEWDRLLNVHLRAAFLLAKYGRDLLASLEEGCFLVVSSVHAYQSVPEVVGYAAAKAGLLALVRGLAHEWGPLGIRANAISPGFIRTALWDEWLAHQPEGETERVNTLHAVGRIGTPEEVAAMALFLASSEAGFITGQDFVLDGGLTTRLRH